MKSILIIYGFFICELNHSLKFICDPQVKTGGSFPVTCSMLKVERGNPVALHIRCWSQTRRNLAFSFGSHTVNKHHFCSLFSAIFSHFYVLCLWVCYLKWLQNIGLKCLSLFLSTRRSYKCYTIFLQVCVIVLLAMSLMLMNERYF